LPPTATFALSFCPCSAAIMVQTRAQAAKNKASKSPDVPKLTRKQKHVAADAAAGDGPSQALTDKPLNVPGMPNKPPNLAKLRTVPCSHPIASLPASPASSPAQPSPGTSQFTIAAVLQQQPEAGQTPRPADADQIASDAAESQAGAEASSVERRQPQGEEDAAAVGQHAVSQPPAAASAATILLEQSAAPPLQQAQAPALQPVSCVASSSTCLCTAHNSRYAASHMTFVPR
jgi:hypothetical protein